MTDSKKRFSNRVENYVKYRPSYPEEAIKFIFEEIGITKNKLIADIGSGTGIFTKLLLEKGNKVYSVEPNKEMREAAEKVLSGFTNFVSVPGSAEETLLEANSIDVITSVQAFHWFNRVKARDEFKRILKPEHKVILIWNKRIADADEFSMEYENLLNLYANDYKEVKHDNIGNEELSEFFLSGVFNEQSFPNYQVFDYEGLLGRLFSSSYSPLPGEKNYDLLITSIKDIFDKYNMNGKIKFTYQTFLYWGNV